MSDSSSRPEGGSSRPWIIAGVIGFLLVTMLMAVRWSSILSQPRTGPAQRVLILPFTSPDPALASGLEREIARGLAARPGLKIVSGGLVTQGAARGLGARQIGTDFGAAWVLEGELEIERGGEALGLTLRLLRVADGAKAWSTRLEAPREDAVKWPAEIAAKVEEQIAADLARSM